MEINTGKGIIYFQDKYKGIIQISFHVHDPVAVIPHIGEQWLVKRYAGTDWVLDKRMETGQESVALTALNPGDRRSDSPSTNYLTGNVVSISGVQANIGGNVNIASPNLNVNSNTIDTTGPLTNDGSQVITFATLPIPTIGITNTSGTGNTSQASTINLISGSNIYIVNYPDPQISGQQDIVISAVVPPVPPPTINFYNNSTLIGNEGGLNLIPGLVKGLTSLTIAGVNNSGANRVDATLTPNTYVTVQGGRVGIRPQINFKNGTNITISGTDNIASNQVDITINNAAPVSTNLVKYVTIGGSVSVSNGANASLTAGAGLGNVVYDGHTLYLFKFVCPSASPSNVNTDWMRFKLYINDGTGSFAPASFVGDAIGVYNFNAPGGTGATGSIPIEISYLGTPAAGTRNFDIWASSVDTATAVTFSSGGANSSWSLWNT